MSKLKMLKPRLKEVDLSRGIKSVSTFRKRTLKDKQESNGRILALDGAAWRKLRAHVLAGEPLCRHCTARGLTVVATDLDHRDNDPTNNEATNLTPLCRECHSRKTNADMGRNVSMGCDSNGLPLDPAHPWNNAAEADLTSPEKIASNRLPPTDCSPSF